MAKLSAAEKQRLYRQRRDADPTRRAEYLVKRQQGYANDITTTKRKKIDDLSERAKRGQRKAWRVNQARHRQHMRAGVWDCPCYSLQEIIVGAVPPTEIVPSAPQQHRPEVIETHHSGQWCIVRYDDQPYPGIILEVEEYNIKVKCMHRNGANRFFWPSPKEDVNWYGDDQIMCFMPEPVPVNKQSVQVDQKIWTYVEGQLHV